MALSTINEKKEKKKEYGKGGICLGKGYEDKKNE